MVNALNCTLSPWRGDNELCRWCNMLPARGGRRFCSRLCVTHWADNHYYWRAKQRAYDLSQGPCQCPDPITPQLGYFDGSTLKFLSFPKPHHICAACGECEEAVEARGDRLSCNHITPRNGLSTNVAHCIHHINNLEILCWRDHGLLNSFGNVRSRYTSWKDYL